MFVYPKCLEPKKGSGQGEDFSLLVALALSHTDTTKLCHLGVRSNTASSLALAFDEMQGETMFKADDTICESSNLTGYSRDASDPKQAMHSVRNAKWLKGEDIEMTGL